MIHLTIVDQHHIEGVAQHEIADQFVVEIVDGGGAAIDIDPLDHDHDDEIDPVAMHAFRRWFAKLAVAGLDAKLVKLDMPLWICAYLAEQLIAEFQQRGQRIAFVQIVEDRGEVTRNATVQRVVVHRLVMRLIRHQLCRLAGIHDRIGGVTPFAILTAIGHVLVFLQLIPAVEKFLVVSDRHSRQIGQ